MLAFTIDASSYAPESWTHVIRGTKDTSIVSMTLDGEASLISHPTSITWQVPVVLAPGDNLFDIVGIDNVGNYTETVTIKVVLPAHIPSISSVFCDTDKHALVAGIRRLPGEKNIFLIRRSLDAGYYPSGTHLQGASDAIGRALGLTPTRDALTIHVNRNSYGNLLSPSASLEITASHILVDADEIVRTEPHHVDPHWPGFYLDYEPRNEVDVEVIASDGTKVDPSQFEVYAYDRHVRFISTDYNHRWVWVRYKYRHSMLRAGNLGSIEDWLESIQVAGETLFTVVVPDRTKNEAGLCQRALVTVGDSDNPIEIDWNPVQVYNLHDRRFRDSLLNIYGAAYGTLLSAWAKTIAKKSKFGWDGVILDVDMWDPLYKKRDNATLPHLSDPYRCYWVCSDPSDTNRYTRSQYVGYGGKCPNHPSENLRYHGVYANQWQSGVGGADDLLVTGLEAKR